MVKKAKVCVEDAANSGPKQKNKMQRNAPGIMHAAKADNRIGRSTKSRKVKCSGRKVVTAVEV